MGNHFLLVLETPESNLVTGMKWMLGVCSQGWNHHRQAGFVVAGAAVLDDRRDVRRSRQPGRPSYCSQILVRVGIFI
jgi:hypothetical protein